LKIAYLEADGIPGSMLLPVSLGYPSLRSGPCFLTNKEKYTVKQILITYFDRTPVNNFNLQVSIQPSGENIKEQVETFFLLFLGAVLSSC
jgi:hypothetical protein